MNGIELSESFFNDCIFPVLQDNFGSYLDDISAALLGDGSEVLGFDDEISHDHNYCPRVLLFVVDKKFDLVGDALLKAILDVAPNDYKGFKLQNNEFRKFIEVVPLEGFFINYLDTDYFPVTSIDWLKLDEQKLLELTSGKIFYDSKNQLRQTIDKIRFYPKDVKYFLLSTCYSRLSEVGGIERSIIRKDFISVDMYRSYFVYFAIKTFHLYKNRFCPYRKWMGINLETLGCEGEELKSKIESLLSTSDYSKIRFGIKDILNFISKAIFTEMELSFNSNGKEKLNLLDFDWDYVFQFLNVRISKDLKDLGKISPLNYWGLIYDFSGYGMNQKEFLKLSSKFIDT